MLRISLHLHGLILGLLFLSTSATLRRGSFVVTNGRVTLPQGNNVQILCIGGKNHSWKKGTKNITTNKSADPEVYQVTGGMQNSYSNLNIRPLKPSNKGMYTCHYIKNGQTMRETVILEIEDTSDKKTSRIPIVTVTRTVQRSSPALRVSWSAVSGSGITYTVCYSRTSGTQSDPPSNADCSTSGITGTSTTLGPLSRGTTYYIWVAAVSAGRQGSYSDKKQNSTYDYAPLTSTVTATPLFEPGKIRVSWTPPTPPTGSTITGYSIQYRIGSSGAYTTATDPGRGSRTTTISSLQLGRTYQVRVGARTEIGVGPSNYKATQVTPYNYAPPPRTVTASPLSERGKIRVSWTPPTPPTGSTITGYSIQYRIGSSGAYTTATDPGRGSRTTTIGGLQLGRTYQVRVGTKIQPGLGTVVSSYKQTQVSTYAYAGAPSNLQALPLSVAGKILVSWTPPTLPIGSIITGYSVQYRIGSSGDYNVTNELGRGATSTTINGLQLGRTYQMRVGARTQLGFGPSSYKAAQVTTHNYAPPPRTVSASPSYEPGKIRVHWTPPTPPTGSTITGYSIQYRIGSSGDYTTATDPGRGSTSTTISGLQLGRTYQVRVGAKTEIGVTTTSYQMTQTITYSIPEQISAISIEISESGSNHLSLTVTWSAPQSDVLITRYEGNYRTLPSGSWTGAFSTPTRQHIYRNLLTGKRYAFRVRAVSPIGEGLYGTKGNLVPSKPVDNIAAKWRSDGSILVRWTPLSYAEARGFPFYIIIYEALVGSSQGNATSTDNYVVISGLNPQIGYTITVEVTTANGTIRGNNTLRSVTLSPQDSFPVGAVVGIVLAIIIVGALVAAAVVMYLCCKRSQACASCKSIEVTPKPIKKKKKADIYEMQPSPEEIYYLSLQVGSMEPIPQSSFSVHVKAMHMERDSGFEREFQTIANDPDGSEEIAMDNRPKNRYLNIHTFDHSRVVLSGNEGSDYINASFIDGYKRCNAYIASQGPLPDTIADFWEMVWEQRSPVIVMLTKLEEKGKVKCEKYWNDELDTPYDLSRNLTVTTRSYKAMADYEIRDIRVVKANGSHNKPLDVVQMQYNGWPDYGVPSHPSSLVKFVQQVRKEYKNSTAPMLVHCSAGVGRTGTFITIDAMLERLQEKDDLIIYQFVTAMRTKRTFMVQTMDQYAFIHDALNDHLTCGDTSVPAHHLRSVIAEMSGPGQETSCTGFEEQFEFLDSLCKTTCDEDDTYSRKGTITKKNRYSDKFPYSHNHLKLHSKTNTNGGDYINASFVDSYSKSKAFIAAQAPLENTRNDIWQLIWQYKMPTVVVLCDFQEDNEETCCKFWPDDVTRSTEYDYLKVNHKDVSCGDSYDMVKLDAFDKSMESKVHNVTLFHTKNWPKNGPVDPNCILKLMGDVEGAHGGKKKPILVLCDDGMGRSGVFICAMSEVERVKVEGEVDVFQTVKAMRSQRPHMVDTPEQYKLCFEILLTHLDSFDTYANFKAV